MITAPYNTVNTFSCEITQNQRIFFAFTFSQHSNTFSHVQSMMYNFTLVAWTHP